MTSMTTKTVVLADLRRVASKVRQTPTRNQYRKHGRFSSWLVEARFGSWGAAIRKV